MMLIIKTFWLLAPGGVANCCASVSRFIFPNWITPLDFGLKYQEKRVFGNHKTCRGLFVGVLGSTIFAYCFQQINQTELSNPYLPNYGSNVLLFGFLSGLFALFADAIKSFFKRRLKIDSGSSWFPFDQTDWVVGVLLAGNLFFKINFSMVLVALLVGVTLHLLVRYFGFLIGTVDKKF